LFDQNIQLPKILYCSFEGLHIPTILTNNIIICQAYFMVWAGPDHELLTFKITALIILMYMDEILRAGWENHSKPWFFKLCTIKAFWGKQIGWNCVLKGEIMLHR